MIELSDAVAGYRNFQLAPSTVTFTEGRFSALIGPNGCGKSTLMRMISRQLATRSGTVRIGEHDAANLPQKTLARQVSLLSQENIAPAGITVRDIVGYGRAPHQNLLGIASDEDRRKVAAALGRMDLTGMSHKPVASLSGGQRQRAFLAMLLAQDTPTMLFDEPTNWLDIQHQVQVLSLIRNLAGEGRTCVAVLHDIAQAARYADHLVVMKDGAIVAQGSPTEVVTAELVQEVYELAVAIHPDPVTDTPVPYPLA
ncbi:ABC transporter ATP-binding protein [Mameliella alba]|uniref:ABC transporter ATP-binding protein n=1 Tax=Mameliella alba TaxID=561184 RepID=UPI001834ACFE|nr:ATP-binding cassette domain-containing protein [Mameliella alba]